MIKRDNKLEQAVGQIWDKVYVKNRPQKANPEISSGHYCSKGFPKLSDPRQILLAFPEQETYYSGIGSRCPLKHPIISSWRIEGIWWGICSQCEKGFPETSPLDFAKGKLIKDLIK